MYGLAEINRMNRDAVGAKPLTPACAQGYTVVWIKTLDDEVDTYYYTEVIPAEYGHVGAVEKFSAQQWLVMAMAEETGGDFYSLPSNEDADLVVVLACAPVVIFDGNEDDAH